MQGRQSGTGKGLHLPMMFERNQGQAAEDVRFLTRSQGRAILFQDQRITIVGPRSRVSLVVAGSSPTPRISGESLLETKLNFLPSPDPKTWVTGVENYAAVRYHDVYPGVDVLVHASRGELEYDLVARPGADLQAVSIRFEGATHASIDKAGDIVVEAADGTIRQHLPEAYQEHGDAPRTKVEARYIQNPDGSFLFDLGAYDKQQQLIVDPVIGFNTFLGRSLYNEGDFDFAGNPGQWDFLNLYRRPFNPIAIDAQGYTYIAGTAARTDLDLPLQQIGTAPNAGLVCKINPTGDAVVFCTLAWLDARSLGVDPAGNIYIGGTGLVSKLSPQGNSLLWSLNTGSQAPISGLAVDQSGSVLLVEGDYQARVLKTKPDGSGFLYWKILNNTASDVALAVAADSNGNAYVTGNTPSPNFPRTAGVSPIGGSGYHVFVVKLDQQGQIVYSYVVPQSVASPPAAGLIYSTGEAIVVDSQGAAYVAGRTNATDLPVSAGSVQPAHAGSAMDGFVLKVNPAGTALDYLTYLGGRGMDEVADITLDSAGNAYLTGRTQCLGFPANDTLGSPALPLGSSAPFFVQVNGQYRRSTDGWGERIRSIAVNPVNPLVIYASSGFDGLLLKSTNGGVNWSNLPSPTTLSIDRLVIDPVTPSTIWAGSTDHFWRSLDSGATWTAVPLPLSNLNGMKADPKNQATRYAFGFAASRPAVARSTDSGNTWQKLGNLYAEQYCYWPYCAVSDLLVDPSDSLRLYAAAGSGVYESTNGGVSWIGRAYPNGGQLVDTRFDPANSMVVWGANYTGVLRSTDRGQSWQTVLTEYGAGALAVIPHPLGGSVYAITGQRYNNVWESKDGGLLWATLSIPAPIYWGEADPSSPGKYILGGASPFHPFLTKLAPDGGSTLYSGCFGGSNDEAGSGIVRDSLGRIYIGGVAASLDFPVSASAARNAFGGRSAWFVAQFTEGPASSLSVQVSPSSVSLGLGQTQQFTATITGGSSAVTWSVRPSTAGTVSASGLYTAPATASAGTVTVYATSVQDPGKSGSAAVILPNPSPTIFALSGYTIPAGTPGLTIGASGTGFVESTVVRWNGSPRKTYFRGPQFVRFELTAADLALNGTGLVTIYNPAPGGGTSGTHVVTITSGVPAITTLSPVNSQAWLSGATLTVNGAGFATNAVVRWNGQDRPTTFVSPSQVTAAIPGSDLLGTSTNQITVFNPAPGGGLSSAVTFAVLDTAPRVISVSPAAGGGSTAVFQARYAMTPDYHQIPWVQLLLAAAPDGGGQPYCFVHYDAYGDGFWLYGEGGFFVGPVKPGTASFALQNSFCALNTKTSSVVGSGGELLLRAEIVFKQAATKNIYLRAHGTGEQDTLWVQKGAWSASPSPMGAMLVSPGSGSGSSQNFQLTYNDPAGFGGTTGGWSQFLVSNAADASAQNFCFFHYDRAGNGIWVYSSDVGFFLGPVQPGVASTALDSSACTVNSAATTVTSQSGAVVVNVPIVFKAPMKGSRNLYQRTLDPLLRDSGWVLSGGWTIP